eukprot:6325838-Heterocapsa_arctica.AAC.1
MPIRRQVQLRSPVGEEAQGTPSTDGSPRHTTGGRTSSTSGRPGTRCQGEGQGQEGSEEGSRCR